MQLNVQIKRVRPNGIIPEYKTDMAAGLDLCACIDEPVQIAPGQQAMIPTGIAVYVGDEDYASVILPRSGLGTKGLVIGNLTGLIDADYQGELMICAWNRNNDQAYSFGRRMEVMPGDRIAQLVFLPIARAKFTEVAEFSFATARGGNGWGSTGVAS